jgi:subfamily B ATP-binding cassette protein HlyB/CyaB
MKRFQTGWALYFEALRSNRRLFAEAMVALTLINLFGFVSPLAFCVIIDKVVPSQAMSTLALIGLGLAAIALFELVFGAVRQRLLADVRRRMDHELGFALFDRLLALPAEGFARRSHAETISRFKRIADIRQFVIDATEAVVVAPLFVMTIVVVMALFSVRLAAAVVLLTALYAGALLLLRPVQRKWFGEVARDQEKMDTTLTEVVRGLEAVKAAGAQQQASQWWRNAVARHGDSNHRASQWQAWSVQLGFLKDRLLSIVALAGGALEVIDGRMSIGSLVAFSLLLRLLASHADRVVPLWHRYLSMADWVKRLDDQLRETVPDVHRQRLSTCRGEVGLQRVIYRYGAGADVLSGINLVVAPGSFVVVVGPTGSGKSTLLKLMAGLYRPRWGTCSVDGFDLRLVDEADLRRCVAIVEQEPVLFHRSIIDNLRLAHPGASFDEVVAAAKLALAHDFIMRLPKQYETVLQEGGTDLSVGQRRCLALARALVVQPRVLLLDEVTSGLDFETERALVARLPSIAEGRTVLMVTHRAECLRVATRILVLAAGRVVEDGSPSALAVRGGYFARLVGEPPKEVIRAAE